MQRTAVLLLYTTIFLGAIPFLEANRCLGRPDGFFANDFRECEAFFTCVRQTAVPGRCPDGFHFNEEEQKCDYPWNVVCLICEESTTEPGVNPIPEFFPIENECRKYTLCAGGIGFLRECSAGLMFDPVLRICDVEDNVNCLQGICPNDINPEQATMVPDPRDCSRYYICFRREAVGGISHACNDGLLFDPISRRCDLAANVECLVPDPPISTECPPTGLHYIPEAGSCSTYFICLNGDRIGPLSCAAGLIFDINTRTCRPRGDEGSQCVTDPTGVFGVQIKT